MNGLPYHVIELSRPDFGLFRAPGPGLGNLLFPIGRAIVAQNAEGGTLVIPTMRQIKLGTYLRQEKDKRTYGNIFRQRTPKELRHWLMSRLISRNADHTKVIKYAGLGRQFHDLKGNSDIIYDFLMDRAAKPTPKIDFDIAMHVRLGDFAQENRSATQQNTRLPLDWYQEALVEASHLLGMHTPRIIVYSDSDPKQIIRDIGLNSASPEPPNMTALNSMLLIAQAKLVIGSRSTFSLWGQYLGKSIGIWPKGYDLGQYKPVQDDFDIFV
jgi:hypothetical protein